MTSVSFTRPGVTRPTVRTSITTVAATIVQQSAVTTPVFSTSMLSGNSTLDMDMPIVSEAMEAAPSQYSHGMRPSIVLVIVCSAFLGCLILLVAASFLRNRRKNTILPSTQHPRPIGSDVTQARTLLKRDFSVGYSIHDDADACNPSSPPFKSNHQPRPSLNETQSVESSTNSGTAHINVCTIPKKRPCPPFPIPIPGASSAFPISPAPASPPYEFDQVYKGNFNLTPMQAMYASPTPSSACIHDTDEFGLHSTPTPNNNFRHAVGPKVGNVPSNVPYMYFPGSQEGHQSSRASIHSGTLDATLSIIPRTRVYSLPSDVQQEESPPPSNSLKPQSPRPIITRKQVPKHLLRELERSGEERLAFSAPSTPQPDCHVESLPGGSSPLFAHSVDHCKSNSVSSIAFSFPFPVMVSTEPATPLERHVNVPRSVSSTPSRSLSGPLEIR